MYDADGIVMRSIPAAGSADFSVSSISNSLGHYTHEVQTFQLAQQLSRVFDYYKVRPIWIEPETE